MGLTVDKIFGPMIHNHKVSDISDIATNYLKLDASNDPITNDLDLGSNSLLITDTNGVKWSINVNTDGALVTTQITAVETGNPIGLLLTLTYA